MRVAEVRIRATDGLLLAATLYEQETTTPSRRCIIIASATGVKRRFYDKYARFLCDCGFSIITFDYRGIGGSRLPKPAYCSVTMRDWGEKDLAGVIDWASENGAGYDTVLAVGHSVGGQLIGLAPNNERIAALLMIASQSGYWRHWPFPRKYVMAVLWYVVVPGLAALLDYFPAKRLGFGEDLPAGVALEWARWCRRPEYITDNAGRPIRRYFDCFRKPILYYSFEDDPYAPQQAVEWLANCYRNAPRIGRRVRLCDIGALSIGHFGFFGHSFKDRLWRGTAEWLEQQAI